jgi:carbon-monoxide dehydrogenase medium subunit
MKPAPFEYHRPDTLEEVIALLADVGDDAKVLAGGQSLVPMLNMRLARFDALIDLGRVTELAPIELDGDGVTIGSMVKQCEIEERNDVGAAIPLLAHATPLIGHFQIRNKGTLGGSIAHADPAAEYPAVALALDAEMRVAGPDGSRTISASDFFTGTWATSMEPGEVLVSVRFPKWEAAGFAVEEVGRRHGDFAIAGACVGVRVAGGVVDKATIALFGVGTTPLRAGQAEAAMMGAAPADIDIEAVSQAAIADIDPSGDLHASAPLRRRIAAAVVGRGLHRALKEATNG